MSRLLVLGIGLLCMSGLRINSTQINKVPGFPVVIFNFYHKVGEKPRQVSSGNDPKEDHYIIHIPTDTSLVHHCESEGNLHTQYPERKNCWNFLLDRIGFLARLICFEKVKIE